jgi:hypothetical protein
MDFVFTLDPLMPRTDSTCSQLQPATPCSSAATRVTLLSRDNRLITLPLCVTKVHGDPIIDADRGNLTSGN